MGAGGYVKQAQRAGMGFKGLARYNTCVCHPQQWGLKKGLRRGRRRLSKLLIREGLEDHDSKEPQ